MSPERASAGTEAVAAGEGGRWRCQLLDTGDADAVTEYERTLYESFLPILDTNPLVRNLWSWDDGARRLRTLVPYDRQRVALMRDARTGLIVASVGTNTRPDLFWQAAAYDFPTPPAGERAGEFLIFARGDAGEVHGAAMLHIFMRGFLFRDLADAPIDFAYATTAEPMLRIYLRAGARIVGERTIAGYRRTLLRWDIRGFRSVARATADLAERARPSPDTEPNTRAGEMP